MSIVVKAGDSISVHYTGTLNDGTIFDSSEGRTPLSFKAKAGQMIKGFDDAVIGMAVGEVKTVTIPSTEAYGEHDETLVFPIDRAQFPDDLIPEIGMQLHLHGGDNQPIPVVITEVGETEVKVDANHRLAGQDLTFKITCVSIN